MLLSKTYICYDKYIKKKNDSLCLDKTSLLLGIGNVIYIKIMTEREKMLAGEIYDCGDEQLIERWHLAKQLQKKYSETDSRDRDTLNFILDELIGGRGYNVWITAPFFVD